ncbi:MAG: PEP-CTERM sorting domain-containing protein [Halochromatium sp.]|uniref:PEP-CTERM sorting domain-containing protein n=1 Tax=Halochromatium sp. TaxID=2049430 RepID=UPI003978650D
MNKTLTTLALTFGLTTTVFAAPLDLTGFQRVGDVSSGTGGIFYAAGLLQDDFVLNPLDFNTDASGGDFQGVTGNGLSYDFSLPQGFVSVDPFGPADSFFDIIGFGFSADTIEFLLDRNDANSQGSNPYPGSARAIFSLTSQVFATAPTTTLDNATSLEQFFINNSDPNSGEYAADVTFSIQALDTVSAVPTPATVALFAIGLVGFGIARQRARLVGKPSSAA